MLRRCTRAIVVALLLALCGQAEAARGLLVYPGSFDPFHLAHRAELEAARQKLAARHPEGVDVVVLPNHDAPKHVPKGYAFDATLRTQLASLSTQGLPGVTVHAPFPDGTETVDQLRAIEAEHPGHKPYLLVGDDAYAGLRHWKGAAEVLAAYHVLVSTPPSRWASLPSPKGALGTLADGAVIEPLQIAVPEVRSHAIRLQLLIGGSVDAFVGPAVAKALRTRPFRAALERNAERLLEDRWHTIADHLGPELVAKGRTEGAIATSLLALSNTRDDRLIRRVAHNLRRRGQPVSVAALRRLAADPAHAAIFQLPSKPTRGTR